MQLLEWQVEDNSLSTAIPVTVLTFSAEWSFKCEQKKVINKQMMCKIAALKSSGFFLL